MYFTLITGRGKVWWKKQLQWPCLLVSIDGAFAQALRYANRFNNVFKTKAQKIGFRDYIGGLLWRKWEEKSVSNCQQHRRSVIPQITAFLSSSKLVSRCWYGSVVCKWCGNVVTSYLLVPAALIIDDSGHRKSAPPAPRFPRRQDGARSGNLTAGVGRQYIGEIGKTDNGVVVVTTHLYDGVKSQHA